MALKTHSLTLLRHAKSDWNDPDLSDHDRPLNQRGERDAPEMGKRLRARGIRPSLLMTSTAHRASQTCKMVAGALGFPVEFIHRERELYLAGPQTILNTLARQDESFHHVLIVCHNPGISEFAQMLSDNLVTEMPTCGMLTIEAETPDWASILHVARRVVGYDFPKNNAGVITRL
ncbi:MAG: histidine phosphatase family protein [Pseudomonadota bacterium]